MSTVILQTGRKKIVPKLVRAKLGEKNYSDGSVVSRKMRAVDTYKYRTDTK